MSRSLWVMIAAAGRPALLKRTLESIIACEKPAGFMRTLVIENGPRSGIEEAVRGLGAEWIQYLYSSEPNKSRALNLGLTRTDGGLVVFTDDDMRVSRDWLTAYAAAAAAWNGECYLGGPIDIDAEHGLPPEWMRRYYPATLVTPWELPHSAGPVATPHQTFMGGNWAACGDAILASGCFDHRLGPRADQSVGEESQLQRRLMAAGATPVYVRAARAWHYLHAECLDPQWLLARTYRHGLAWGMRLAESRQTWTVSLAAAALRRSNAQAKASLLRLLGGERRRFHADYLLARWQGRWDGLWQAARRTKLAASRAA